MIAASLFAIVTAAAQPGIRLSVAGDSLALGIGASDSGRGFAFDLFRRVEAVRPGSEITNVAIGGTTVRDVLRLEIPRLAETTPQLVLVEAGANDAVQRRSAKQFARDYRALVDGVRRAAPSARLVLFTVPDVSVSPIFERNAKPALHKLVLGYNVAVREEAVRARARVVDLFSFSLRARADNIRYFSVDQFHPSDAGHAAIADAAWPVVFRSL